MHEFSALFHNCLGPGCVCLRIDMFTNNWHMQVIVQPGHMKLINIARQDALVAFVLVTQIHNIA